MKILCNLKMTTFDKMLGTKTTKLFFTHSLPASYVSPVANQVVDLYSKNPMVYKSNTSRMFFSLFQNDRLDEYLDNNHRDLVLDTQILLQVCCVSFDGMEPDGVDVLYKVGKRFWKSTIETRTVKLHTTVDYITEVASHMLVAHKLSRFLDLEYIKDLGPSKNIFFNHYLLNKEANDYDTFDDYLCDLLDIDYSDIDDKTLIDIAYKRFLSIFEDLGIEVTNIPEVTEYAKYKKDYDITMDFNGYQNRSYNARQADLHAALYVGNLFGDFESTPYFVTTDTSFVIIRDRLTTKFEDIDYWYVYSPQKMTEALQLSQFKIDPEMIDDNIISLTESNFNTSNDTISFIDLLNTFVDKKQLTDWRLAAKLSRIRRIKFSKVYDNVLQTGNQPIDEFLALLCEFYQTRRDGYKFAELKDLFVDNDAADEIANYIQQQIDGFKLGSDKLDENTYRFFDSLILAKINKETSSR